MRRNPVIGHVIQVPCVESLGRCLQLLALSPTYFIFSACPRSRGQYINDRTKIIGTGTLSKFLAQENSKSAHENGQ